MAQDRSHPQASRQENKVNDRELIQQLLRALEAHDEFLWLVKQIVGYTERAGRKGISAGATEELKAAYPPDPVDVIRSARSRILSA